MTRLVLHIGQSKTGTSTIQRYLANLPEGFAGTGLLYPESGRQGEAHHKLAGSLFPKGRRPAWVAEGDPEDIGRRLAAEVRNKRAETVLVSSEIFFDVPDGSIVAARQFAERYDASVLVLVRRQDLWLDSLLQHQMKVLETHNSTDAWLQLRLGSRAVDYDQKVAGWEARFGVEAVKLGLFEKAALDGGLVGATLRLIDTPLPDDFVEPDPVNEKMCRDAIALLQMLHFVCGVDKKSVLKLRAPLEDYSRDFPDPPEWKHLLTPAQRREVIERCSDSNARLCARHFGRGRESLFLDQAVDEQYAPYPGLDAVRTHRMLEFLAAAGADRTVLDTALLGVPVRAR